MSNNLSDLTNLWCGSSRLPVAFAHSIAAEGTLSLHQENSAQHSDLIGFVHHTQIVTLQLDGGVGHAAITKTHCASGRGHGSSPKTSLPSLFIMYWMKRCLPYTWVLLAEPARDPRTQTTAKEQPATVCLVSLMRHSRLSMLSVVCFKERLSGTLLHFYLWHNFSLGKITVIHLLITGSNGNHIMVKSSKLEHLAYLRPCLH